PDGAANVAYPAFLLAPIGGAGQPYSLTLVSPSNTLPPGLTFDVIACAADCRLADGTLVAAPIQFGRIQGTPTASGTFAFDVRVVDRLGRSSDQSLIIRVDGLDITTTQLPVALIGEPYTATLTATGVGAVTWSIVSGALPPGLSLSGNAISGTATGAPSFYSFTVRAIDSLGQRAFKNLGISVQQPNQLVITSTTLTDGVAPWNYFECIHWQGGFAPPTWTVTGGSLPYGISLNPSNGCFSGNILETGAFTFDVTAENGSQRASRQFTLRAGTVEQAEFFIDPAPDAPAVTFPAGTQLAQVFTAAMDGYLIDMQIPVVCAAGVRLDIRGVTDGRPNDAIFEVEHYAPEAVGPFTFGPFHRQLRLTTPLYVTKGTQLAAVLSSGGSCSVTPMQAWSSANDTRYAFGDAFIGGGAFWTPLGDLDPSRPDIPFHAIVDDGGRLLFEVFGRSESVPVSLNIGPNAGTVMFAGGSTDTASLFNATTTTINQLPPRRFGNESTLAAQRRRHTATALPDGRVLVVGGWDDRTGSAAGAIELYDPATNAWTTVAQLATPRFNPIAALVRYDAASRAQVLIAGGQTA